MSLIGCLSSFFEVALRTGVACLKLLSEVMMKGRRKVISHRWSLQAQFEAEARRTLAKRSKKNANRFLDAALVFGGSFEPAGRLAGDSCKPHVEGQKITPTKSDVTEHSVR
jgi:hypothetical protein